MSPKRTEWTRESLAACDRRTRMSRDRPGQLVTHQPDAVDDIRDPALLAGQQCGERTGHDPASAREVRRLVAFAIALAMEAGVVARRQDRPRGGQLCLGVREERRTVARRNAGPGLCGGQVEAVQRSGQKSFGQQVAQCLSHRPDCFIRPFRLLCKGFAGRRPGHRIGCTGIASCRVRIRPTEEREAWHSSCGSSR